MMLPQERYVLSEIFVNVRRFSQKLQARKLNRIKRETMARHPRTKWRIWARDVTLTSRMGLLPDRSNWGLRIRQEYRERCPRHRGLAILGVVSLTFRELSKIILQNYTMSEITFMVRISSWNSVCVPKTLALGTRTKFRLEILIRSTISAIHKFRENILESSRNVSETTPRPACTSTRAWRTCWDACRDC